MTAPRQALVLLLPLLAMAPGAGAADWEPVLESDGIQVSERRAPGQPLPVSRAVGEIDANLWEVLAVIQDVSRHTEWMFRCEEARLLRTEGDRVSFVYNRTRAPWPAAAREAVVRTELIVIEPGVEAWQRFQATDAEPFAGDDSAVRMPRLEGHYKLRALSAERTRVEYQVDSDPGGSLPRFVARMASRDLPLKTLVGLRAQVAKTRGHHSDFVERWRSRPATPR